MDNIQLNKVKISVTELDSFILKSRKDLQKAKINKNKFLRKQAKLEKREEKEKKTEKIKPVTSFLKAGAQKITSKVMPIFDTAMNFFGTLHRLGIIDQK